MKRKLLLWLFGLLLTVQMYAQNRTISGTVKDAKGEALIGVNVTGKGTTIGTVTDIDGKYTLELPKEVGTLVFSYVGYTTLEKAVTAKTIDAVLNEEGQVITEVVISAQNIQRNKSDIIYSQTTVKNDDLNKVSNKSALNALQGKVAGVNISSASGAVGASTRVVLRGENSILGNNNALIIVDGVPINNSSTAGGGGIDANGVGDRDNYVDFGNRANDINPDDIESVNVLKGPAATTLYGSRGSSGVILITTKKGKAKKGEDKPIRVSVGTSVSFDKAYIILKRQNQWGSGYASGSALGGAVYINMGENFSWGPKLDGIVRPWTSLPVDADGNFIPLTNGKIEQLARPYSAVENQLQSFFDLGVTNKNTFSIEGGNDKYSFYASYVNTNQKGTLPYSWLKKNSVLVNANADFNEKINANFSVGYTNVKIKGGTEGGYPFGQSSSLPAYAMALQTPVNIPFSEMRDYNSPYQDMYGFYAQYSANPYFLLGESENINSIDNIIGKLELNYKPAKGLTLTARAGVNNIAGTTTEKTPQYQYHNAASWIDGYNDYGFNGDRADGNKNDGAYAETHIKRNILNLDLIGTYTRELGKKKLFNITLIGGLNSSDERSSSMYSTTFGGLVIPGYYNLSNGVNGQISTNTTNTPYRLLGLYGTASVGYKNVLNLEYSARNDWSSRLLSGKNSFFYQAGGLSFRPLELISQSKSNKWIPYIKLRGDIGTTGKDPFAQYLTETYFVTNPVVIDNGGIYDIRWPFNGYSGSRPSNLIGNADLKPELTTTYEGGIDLGFFQDRLNIEYTYYNSKTKDNVVPVSIAPSSGFSTVYMNVGKVTNSGHELQVKATPYKNKWMDWSVFFTFSKNKSVVNKVSDAAKEVNLTTGIIPYAAQGTSDLVIVEGMSYGVFKVIDYLTDPQGHTVVNAQGAPIQDKAHFKYVESREKFRYSFGSDLNIKGLNLHVLFDARVGGKFMSVSRISTDFNGTAAETAMNDRLPFVVNGSVQMNVSADGDTSYTANAVPTSVYTYFNGAPSAHALVDASYLKLREVSASYTLAPKAFKNTPIKSIVIGFYAKNLKYWLAKSNEFADPETSGYGLGGNAQNIESHSTPSSRSFGFDFKLNF